jgi:flavin-dependent dehydrogenase
MFALTDVKPSYDAVVVGARCAGAATAMLLARQGLDVLVVERSPYGSDTLSTHALMRGGVLQLRRWGLLDAVEAAGTPAVRTTSFHYGESEVAIPIKPRDGVDALYAPRRTVLDALLADAARGDGADLVHGVRLVDLLRTPAGRVAGVLVQDRDRTVRTVRAGIVIGADGASSTVARLTGAPRYRTGAHAGGVVYGYWSGLDVRGYHWHFRPGVSAGVIPTNDGLTCVFAATPAARFMNEVRVDLEAGYRRVLQETSAEVAASILGASRIGPLRGFAGQPGFVRESLGPGWALVGDAAYFKDPITAHGITDALRDAELLARAIARGSNQALAEYQSTRDDLSEDVFRVSDDIASFEWDLASLEESHLTLSRAMNREVAWLAQLDAVAVPA